MEKMPILGAQPAKGVGFKQISGTVQVSDALQPTRTNEDLETPEHPADPSQNLISEEENSKMQIRWNKAMCEEMKIPQGYQNIAVLIIKWADEIDQLKCAKEVEDVRKLFAEDFNFPTRVMELDNKTRPQLQLHCGVINFVSEYNGEHNLFIIYYSGHGSYDEKSEEFSLHAGLSRSDDRFTTPTGTYPAIAVWNNAEKSLIEHAECDMLTIFDSCYASNIHKGVRGQDPRTYEMLTATGHDQQTAGPGPKSFTAALVRSLRALREEYGDEPFTTHQLCEKINLHTERRKNQGHIWNRFKRFDRTIAIAPLKKTIDERKKEYTQEETRSLLTLTLPLTVTHLTDVQLEQLARSLSKAVKDVKAPVKRVDWRKLRSSGRSTNFAGLTKVHRFAKRWRSGYQHRMSQSPAPTRDEQNQTTDDVRATTDDGCQTTEADAVPIKRKELSETEEAPISPLKRSRSNNEAYQTPTDLNYQPPTPPGGEVMEVD